MGRITTPKYILRMSGFRNSTHTPSAWKGKLPTVQQLEQIVMEYVVSTMPGYCNEHIGKAYGIEIPSRATVCRNVQLADESQAMVEWKAPAFLTLPDPKDYPNVAKSPKSVTAV